MELVEKNIEKDENGVTRYYLSILFSSGEEQQIEVSKKTYTKEEYVRE